MLYATCHHFCFSVAQDAICVKLKLGLVKLGHSKKEKKRVQTRKIKQYVDPTHICEQAIPQKSIMEAFSS